MFSRTSALAFVARRGAKLRDVFHAAGGNHPDLDTYDRVMADERRCAVLLTPTTGSAWTHDAGDGHRGGPQIEGLASGDPSTGAPDQKCTVLSDDIETFYNRTRHQAGRDHCTSVEVDAKPVAG